MTQISYTTNGVGQVIQIHCCANDLFDLENKKKLQIVINKPYTDIAVDGT